MNREFSCFCWQVKLLAREVKTLIENNGSPKVEFWSNRPQIVSVIYNRKNRNEIGSFGKGSPQLK